MHSIREPRELVLALLDDAEGQHGKVHADDAAANRLPLALARSSRSVAGVPVGEQQSDSRRVHHALLHREALFVVAARDAEDVAFEFVAQAVAGNLLAHSSVNEDAELALIVNLDQFLRPVGRVGDVELHLDDRGSRWKQLVGREMVCCAEVLVKVLAVCDRDRSRFFRLRSSVIFRL